VCVSGSLCLRNFVFLLLYFVVTAYPPKKSYTSKYHSPVSASDVTKGELMSLCFCHIQYPGNVHLPWIGVCVCFGEGKGCTRAKKG